MPYGLLSCLWPRGPDRECRAKIQRKSFRPTTPSYKQPQSNIVEHIKPRPKKPSRLKDLASKDIFLRCLHEQHQLIASFYLSPSNHIQLQFKHNSSETNFILSCNCNLGLTMTMTQSRKLPRNFLMKKELRVDTVSKITLNIKTMVTIFGAKFSGSGLQKIKFHICKKCKGILYKVVLWSQFVTWHLQKV